MDIIGTVASTLLSLAIRNDVFTMPVEGIGEYRFNPKISQHEACKRAEDRAKASILTKSKGQEFSTQQSEQCVESKDTLTCKNHSVTVESNKGVIREIVSREEHVHDWVCTVKIRAKVDKEETKFDPDFDIEARLNKSILQDGEGITFNVSTNSDGYLSVFHFYPATNTLTKLFPNEFERQNKLQKNTPIAAPSKDYRFKVALTNDQHSHEYVYFVYTDRPINFLGTYQLTDFTKAWDNINTKKRLVKRGFVIIKGDI